jgi:hypothetical protein
MPARTTKLSLIWASAQPLAFVPVEPPSLPLVADACALRRMMPAPALPMALAPS